MAERMVERARLELSADPQRLAAALGSNIPAPQPKTKQAKRAKAKEKDKGETVSFNGAVVGATPPAIPVQRENGVVVVDVPAGVAVRLRDDADEVVRASLKDEPEVRWKLAGVDGATPMSAQEVRAAASEIEALEIAIGKVLSEPERSDRRARVSVDGAGLVVPLTVDEAQVLLDDAARRVLVQLKGAGVRGRVRVEFEIETGDGTTRDSRPGAVRKLARGETVGASPERRERRRRSRSRRGPKPPGDGGGGAEVEAASVAESPAESA
jgi:hypothetical protein